jgi:hypothetical protein
MKTALLFLSASLCLALATQPSAAQTVAVGKCQPHLTSYSTISAAVAAEPSGATILICPGTYPEQVVITQPVTLKGLSLNTGSNPVVTVPKGGLASGTVAQISAQENPIGTFGPVNISNLIVDGSNSGVVCSDTSYLVGIGYEQSWGTLENLEVRNQSPGGCGVGIEMFGGPEEGGTWVLRNSFIHDFDSQGVWAGSQYPGFTIASNSVASAIGSGIILDGPGTAANNIISVGGQIGLALVSVYPPITAKYNTITGAAQGIFISGGAFPGAFSVTDNSLVNNSRGMVVDGNTVAQTLIESNSILQSATAAIDLQCNTTNDKTIKQNSIFNAPVGVANVAPPRPKLTGNLLYKVTTATTTCPSK